ncbi:MAG: Blue-light-activated protein [Syntrophorhabdaceae bacterium PtaU1.Bin034]|nr:MAG: Blue-light-activated protein [Syntrophorhabdaceae bacterium PtaU1.Bin034]
MLFAKILPKKFSSRLFLMTFIAGLIPIIVFTVLINIYGSRIQNEITRIIEEGYRQDMWHSEMMLREMGEASIYGRAVEMAQQLDMIIESVPWMTVADLQKDIKFRELAVQNISQTGYTYLFESKTGMVRFHRDRRLENKNLRRIFGDLPEFQAILARSLRGPSPANGYYQLKAGDGHIMKRFIYIIPLNHMTADDVRMSVAATVNIEDFSTPLQRSQEIHSTTKKYLTNALNRVTQSLRHSGLLFMGIGILTVSALAFFMGVFSSRAVTRLREATARINQGDFSGPVKVSASGEVATLVEDFNKMVDQLATTTVSKQLLEASEARLKIANSELRKEIAERERTEKELATEKERLNVTLRSIGDGVITADSTGRIVLINNAAEQLTGWRQEEATGHDLWEVFRTDGETPHISVIGGKGPQGGQKEFEASLNRKVLVSRDRTERIIAETRSPICDKEGNTLGTVIVFRDITHQKKVEEELLNARKLESLGVLAGGIAHDFNNLLAVVLGNISFAKMFIRPEEKVFDRLSEAEKACLRGKDLTYQLLAFARGGEPLRTVSHIGRLIEDSTRSCLTESKVDAVFSFHEDLLPVKIDEEQMRQVILRMVDNADEAMEGKGILRIGAENTTIDPGSPLTVKPGEYVHIFIQDEGPGIAEEDLQRIFDPYFTKKQMGHQKGTGLGLSICYSIIKDHGGVITVESETGKGTTFHIYLPAVTEEAHQEAADAAQSSGEIQTGRGGKGKLLFMDDDEGVRDVIVEILIHLGYDVQFARDGLEAIEQYRAASKSGRPFDVVIADLTVPEGMGGKELIKQLHKIDPRVRAIISSGYSNDPVLDNFRKHGFQGVVAKPYKIEELCTILEEVMNNVRTQVS